MPSDSDFSPNSLQRSSGSITRASRQSYDRRVARDSRDILDDPPPPAADARLAYGPEPNQFGDLRLPAGEGPFPLVVFVHGGAWEAQYNLISAGHLCMELRG